VPVEKLSDVLTLLLVCSLPVMQPFNLTVSRYTVVPADFVFVLAALAFSLAVVTGRRTIRFTPWCWTLIWYAAAMIASTVASADPRRSAFKLVGELYLLGMAYLIVNYVANKESLRRVIIAWLVGVALTAVAAVLGIILFVLGFRNPAHNIFLFPFGSLPPGPYPRVVGLFQNANMLCTYAVASVTVILSARTMGWIGPVTSRGLLVATVVTGIFSLSPGLGGLFLAFALWYAKTIRTRMSNLRWPLLLGGGLAALMFVGATLVSPPSVFDGWKMAGFSHWAPSSRLMTWRGAWATFLAHPAFGRGLGLEVADVHYVNASGYLEVLTDAHNTWLSVLAQDGIVGGLAFSAVVIYLVRRSRWLHLHSMPSPIGVGIEIAVVAGFLYQTLSGSFENTRHVWVLLALLAAAQDLDAAAERTV